MLNSWTIERKKKMKKGDDVGIRNECRKEIIVQDKRPYRKDTHTYIHTYILYLILYYVPSDC